MRTALIKLTVLALTVVVPNRAAAWHHAGHLAIARAAWKDLTDRERAQCVRFLKTHPHYSLYLTVDCPKDLPEIEWAFMRASTWPDWIRSPSAPDLSAEEKSKIRSRYNKPVWHYINLPYVHPADAGRFDAAAIRKTILEPEFDDEGEPRHVLAAIKLSTKQLHAAETSDLDKSIALCWLLHLIGDLHQPLHGTSMIASKDTYDPQFDPPHGDLGGNRQVVRKTADDKTAVSLHFYWDALLFHDASSFAEIEGAVTGFMTDLKREQLDELKATEFLAWAEESLELAKTVVYKGDNGVLKAYPLASFRTTKLAHASAPVLPAGYQKAAEAVARRRMTLAAHRIADQLHLVSKANK